MSALDVLLPLPDRGLMWPWTGRVGELPDHLSATQFGMADRCSEQYRRRYVLGERERPGAALIWGGADHAAHEVNFRQKIDSHEDIPVTEVEYAFADAFDRKVNEAGGEDEIEWGSDKPGALKDAGVELVGVYHRQVSPSVQPVQVEREFRLEVPGSPVPVVGFMDIVTDLPVIERKTSKRSSSVVLPKWRVQGLLYQLVERRPVEWHLSVKTKTPAVITPVEAPGLSLPVSAPVLAATERLVATTARKIQALYEMFGPDEPWPGAISHDWACGFCGYRPTCAWWGNA